MLETAESSDTNGCSVNNSRDQDKENFETTTEVGLRDGLMETCIVICESSNNNTSCRPTSEGLEKDPDSVVISEIDIERPSECNQNQNGHGAVAVISQNDRVKWSSNLEIHCRHSPPNPANRGEKIIQLLKNFRFSKLDGWIVTAIVITIACIFCLWFFNHGAYLLFASRLKQSKP